MLWNSGVGDASVRVPLPAEAVTTQNLMQGDINNHATNGSDEGETILFIHRMLLTLQTRKKGKGTGDDVLLLFMKKGIPSVLVPIDKILPCLL